MRLLSLAGVGLALLILAAPPVARAGSDEEMRILRCLQNDPPHLIEVTGNEHVSCGGELFLSSDTAWGYSWSGRSLDLVSHPGATLELGLRIDDSASLPPFFSVQVLRKDSDAVSTAESERFDRAICERETARRTTVSRFRCQVPRDTEALRVEIEGFGTKIVWDVQPWIASGRPLVLDLSPGVLVTGRTPAAGLVATLEPRGARPDEHSGRFASSTAVQHADGSFTFVDTAPGAYRVRLATADGQVSATDVVIPLHETFSLPELANPRRLDVPIQIEPRSDGSGETWKVTLVPTDPARSRDRPASGAADETGWLVFEDLPPGDYLLVLEDSEGSTWSIESVRWIDDSVHHLEIDAVRIEGEATLGDEPFTGEMVFGTTHGSQRIRVRADENGDFHGLLPREGVWKVEIVLEDQGCDACGGTPGTVLVPSVEVEAGPSGVARFDVAIPDTRIDGRVVREEITSAGEVVRTPQSGALVVLARVGGPASARGRQAQVWTDEDGRFRIQGIEPGTVEIGALLHEPAKESRWQTLDVREGLAAPRVELVLEEKVATPVLVTGLGGAVGGAEVLALPDGGMSARGVTGADGSVPLDLPARGSGVLLVKAAGFGLALRRFDLPLDGRGVESLVVPLVAASGAVEIVSASASFLDEGWLAAADGATIRLRSLVSYHQDSVQFAPSFVIGDLQPGGYAFCVRPAHCESFEIRAQTETPVDLSDL